MRLQLKLYRHPEFSLENYTCDVCEKKNTMYITTHKDRLEQWQAVEL